jgi:hypothetical protein
MLTRNEYITYFNSYFRQNGPFSLVKETTVKSDIMMSYVNQANTKQYALTFMKTGSTWKLAYPTVD